MEKSAFVWVDTALSIALLLTSMYVIAWTAVLFSSIKSVKGGEMDDLMKEAPPHPYRDDTLSRLLAMLLILAVAAFGIWLIVEAPEIFGHTRTIVMAGGVTSATALLMLYVMAREIVRKRHPGVKIGFRP